MVRCVLPVERPRPGPKVAEWFLDFEQSLWLKDDDTGKDDARFIRHALRLKRGSSVLDAPCGAGRIAVHLAKAGCAVTGVDREAAFIRRARRRFRSEGLKGTFLVGDVRDLDFDGEFHAVYNWGGSFGYFSDDENLEVLRGYARALKRGGRLMVEQPNREYILRHFRRRGERGGVRTRTKWSPRTERVETTWTCTLDGRRRSCRSVMRLFTPGQFARLFARVGLDVVATYGSLDGETYRRRSRRLYVVGRKR